MKLTCGAGCPEGRGVLESRSYTTRTVSGIEAGSSDVDEGSQQSTKMLRTLGGDQTAGHGEGRFHLRSVTGGANACAGEDRDSGLGLDSGRVLA